MMRMKHVAIWTKQQVKPAAIAALAILAATPAFAQSDPRGRTAEEEQQQPPQQQLRPPDRPTQSGRTADTSVGQVGQRQGWATTTVVRNPMQRIASRIQNRVESRIRNRIDRNYDPQANARTPFAAAEQETRAVGRRSR